MAAMYDLVLVHIDHKPGFYARIEDISPDVKPGWWQVKLLALSFPLQVFTWILDSSQIEGEPFTMGGTPVRVDKVVCPEGLAESSEPAPTVQDTHEAKPKKAGGKVVSLAERKKGR